jgi:aminopeptidase S
VAELSQQVSIPAGATSLSLTYWYWAASLDTCGYDHGWFEVNGTQLKTYNLCLNQNTGGWVMETVNLAGYAGQTVTIKFHLDTNASKNSNFFLDDVAFPASSSAAAEMPSAPVRPPGLDVSDAQPRR